ncbi:MAG TPA: hypothetical protein PKA64_05325 [Myxococcota bacterium]|nr:hypothetical protein [Myxococcota bacterium]
MSATFVPMTSEQKARFRVTYLDYLRRRDGAPDLDARRFDVRERFFAEIDGAPCLWQGPLAIDQAVFDRNHALRRPEPDLDEVTLWALATAKTNRAERFGVELSIDNTARTASLADDPHTYIQIEEFYHTRILRDALATLGVTMEVATPGARTRLLVRAMVHLPALIADTAVFCGEIVGVTIFSLLLERARDLFAAQPAALARVERLFGQILVDEVGHVHYVRSRLSPAQIAAARRLLPIVVASVLDDIPELGLLFGAEVVHRRATEADVDAASAAYPDRLVFSA